MDIAVITEYFTKYGAVAIFVMVFLEYLNLPGFPAGIIMPLAGIFARQGAISFPVAMLLTLGAGLLGSLMLYGAGYLGGDMFLRFYTRKFPKQKPVIEKHIEWLRGKGCIGVFTAKLLPAVRTLISLPAGAMKMNLWKYIVSSAAGIFLWNLVFIGAGYLLGDTVFTYLG